jgi:hypothetical protein
MLIAFDLSQSMVVNPTPSERYFILADPPGLKHDLLCHYVLYAYFRKYLVVVALINYIFYTRGIQKKSFSI